MPRVLPKNGKERMIMAYGVEIAKPFVNAAVNVVSTMASITPKAQTPFVKKTGTPSGDVTAIIGFTGQCNGTIAVSFTRPCAIALVRAMLGDDIQDIIQDTKDAVGELTNMISGQARQILGEMGLKFQGSTPSIILGRDLTVTHAAKGPVIAIPFTTPHGDFMLEFCFQE